jgi:hypothetical protein
VVPLFNASGLCENPDQRLKPCRSPTIIDGRLNALVHRDELQTQFLTLLLSLLEYRSTTIMATGGAKQLGVTPPLSMAMPTDAENQASNALIEELKREKNYESTAETQKRYFAYNHLARSLRGALQVPHLLC